MKPLIRILVLSLVFAVPGCKKEPKDRVLAVVGGRAVTQREFETYLKVKHIPPGDTKRANEALERYLERDGLASAIEEQKLVDPDVLRAELDEFRRETAISRYFEKLLDDKVDDAAVKNFYDAHAKDYEERKVHVAHILIRTTRGMSETERKAKLTTLQEAYSKIQSGKDFAEIATEYSEDKVSGHSGGDLGWMKEGSVDPRFSKTVFEMQPGTVSEPFETAFGFHVVKVLEAPRTIEMPLAAKAGDIRYELRNKAKEAEVQRLKGLAKIEKKEPYAPSPGAAAVNTPDKPPQNARPFVPPAPPPGGLVLTSAPGSKPIMPGAPASKPIMPGAPGSKPATGAPGSKPATGAPGSKPAIGAPGSKPAPKGPGNP